MDRRLSTSPESEDADWEFLWEPCDCERRAASKTDKERTSLQGRVEWPIYPTLVDILCGPGDPTYHFRGGDVLRTPVRGASAFWAAAGVYFDSIEAVRDLCSSGLMVSPGLACGVWSLVDDAQPERWLVLFLSGVYDGVQLGYREWTAEQFIQGLVSPGRPLFVDVDVGFVKLIPWWDFRNWRKQCDFLLDSSLCAWSLGEDMDVVESRIHREIDNLLA